MSVERKKFYSIKDFDLISEMNITFSDDGVFEEENGAWMREEPYKEVTDYMIRSAFMSAIAGTVRLRDKTYYRMINDDPALLEEIKDDAEVNIPEWRQVEPKSIFNFTKFEPFYLFKFLHPKVCQEFQKEYMKKKGTKAVLRLEKNQPERFQVVMVASELLKHMFKEDCLRKDLLNNMKDHQRHYQKRYGSTQEVLDNAHYLEQVSSALPISDRIPIDQFRLVVSNKLAAIASFFALAIYDQQSFQHAQVLLMDGAMISGQTIPLEVPLFKKKLDKDQRMRHDMVMSLFPQEDVGVESKNFITNVVEVLNQFATFIDKDSPTMKRCDTGAQTRMAHHQFRTLASDFVEIYVSHGLHPKWGREGMDIAHPILMMWINNSEEHEHEWPLSLILKYVMLAIQNRQITVGASHSYNGRNSATRKLEIFNAPEDQEFGIDLRKKERPQTRDIRLLYQLVGAMVGGETKKYDAWLTLPEVVNVILFGLRNAWIKDLNETEAVDWIPTLRSKKIKIMKNGKEKKTKNNAAEPTQGETKTTQEETNTETDVEKGTTETTATEPKTDETREEEEVDGVKPLGRRSATGLKTVRLDDTRGISGEDEGDDKKRNTVGDGTEGSADDKSSSGEDDEGEIGLDDNKSSSSGEKEAEMKKDEASYNTEEDLLKNLLANADKNMVEMIARGKGEVDERYLEYLDIMKNLGITTCLLADLQRKMVLNNFTLGMGENPDMESILQDFNEFLLKQNKKTMGQKMFVADYGKPKDKTWISGPRRLNSVVDAYTSGMMETLSQKRAGGVLSMEPRTEACVLSQNRAEDTETGRLVLYDMNYQQHHKPVQPDEAEYSFDDENCNQQVTLTAATATPTEGRQSGMHTPPTGKRKREDEDDMSQFSKRWPTRNRTPTK